MLFSYILMENKNRKFANCKDIEYIFDICGRDGSHDVQTLSGKMVAKKQFETTTLDSKLCETTDSVIQFGNTLQRIATKNKGVFRFW